MKQIKRGNWVYRKTNQTLYYYSPTFRGYEVDLERGHVGEWIDHMYPKRWLSAEDFEDFRAILLEVKRFDPTLPIFTNPPPKWGRAAYFEECANLEEPIPVEKIHGF